MSVKGSPLLFEKHIYMIAEELTRQIVSDFGFVPTQEQYHAIHTFSSFFTDNGDRVSMIMRGSAGTGKTSVAGTIVRTMKRLGQKVVLLAPTGRAAKVFSEKSDHDAFTIHRRIYRQKTLNGGFELAPNMMSDTLFMVDEASMIANFGQAENVFGNGRLLDDLVSFVYSGRNCRLFLIGDKAQLPPVGEEESPALNPDFMAGYGLVVYTADINMVLRQSQNSGILYNATVIRQMITHDEMTELPKIKFSCFADISIVPGSELVESLSASYSFAGIDNTIVITRSNKRANIYNKGIRNMVLDREEMLDSGDILMIVKNNYYWMEKEIQAILKEKNGSMSLKGQQNIHQTSTVDWLQMKVPAFLANGDHAVIQRVRNVRELYGFTFADLWLRFPDYDNYELKATVLTDSLLTEAPSLTSDQSALLFNAVMEDYADVRLKSERIKKIKEDPYFNAIQIKYAYAITCHKAQGGQWSHVYIDQGYMTDDMLTPDYIHWLYTAFTRATERLYLVNWPTSQIEDL